MAFVFDSSALISISQSCLINIMPVLKERLGNEFYISRNVWRETVAVPLKIKRFELSAVRIKKIVDSRVLKIAELNSKARARAEKIIETANSAFYFGSRPIKLLHLGEAETLALIKQLNASALIIDERTARMLIEAPQILRSLMQIRHDVKISTDMGKIKMLQEEFSGTAIARSVELIALSYELGILQKELPKSRQSLEAALYAAKYNGCAVSGSEIERFLGH